MTVANHKGRPIMALGAVLGGWVMVRAVIVATHPLTAPAETLPALLAEAAPRPSPAESIPAAVQALPLADVVAPPPNPPPPMPLAGPVLSTAASAVPTPVPSVQPALAVRHLSFWMAAFAQVPSPDGVPILPIRIDDPTPAQIAATAAFVPSLTGAPPAAAPPRWSGDGWLLWRGSGGALAAGQGGSAYGASQAGAVLRYRLAPGNPHRPTAALRLTSALATGERELALGIGLRPLARLPVSLAAEARVFDSGGRRQVRPALVAVTEIAPLALPGGFRLETYGQAGWVGGRNRTLFADGQARADHRLARLGKSELRLGVGVWGGAQKGAARLDVGPGASLGVPLSREASARLALDWRLRVAGDARPASGPALTLSAGF